MDIFFLYWISCLPQPANLSEIRLCSLHDAVLDPVAVLPGTGTLLLNNYWADGQHKVPGI